MRYDIIFCENLKTIRKEQGLKQEELAEMADIDSKNYGRIERMEISPTLTTIFKICEALEISPFILFKQKTQ